MELGEQQMNSFDTVDLTEKTVPMELGEQEMNGFVHTWQRKQYLINIRNQVSTLNEISTGVPQGSVLGPLLFLFYINLNDLHKCMKYSKTYHFADDTSTIQSHILHYKSYQSE